MIPFSELAQRFTSAESNRFTEALTKRQTSGQSVVDLINPNWFENGIAFPDELLSEAYQFALTQTQSYRPDSHGNPILRQAIADWYQRRGEHVAPDSIFITPGSSFAYLALFRLLGSSGEALCPQPSYPLFEDIAAVAGWNVTGYPLDSTEQWRINSKQLANRISNHTRAICLVSPHNPTGAILSQTELTEIGEVSTRFNIPVLFDEVFCEFRYATSDSVKPQSFPRPSNQDFPLVFILNGFSKLFALPGHKIGWIIVRGSDKEAVATFIKTLDYLFDAFLPVSEVAQAAATYLLTKDGGNLVDSVTNNLCEKLSKRRDCVKGLAKKAGIEWQPPEGGVYAIFDLPEHTSAEQFAIDLIEKTGIVVHPGYFYDLPYESIVFTFLLNEEMLTKSLPVMFKQINRKIFTDT